VELSVLLFQRILREMPYQMTQRFIRELLSVFPESVSKPRQRKSLKEIVDLCKAEGFTALILIEETQQGQGLQFRIAHSNLKEHLAPDRMWVISLPDGPTAYFRLSSIRLRKSIAVCNVASGGLIVFADRIMEPRPLIIQSLSCTTSPRVSDIVFHDFFHHYFRHNPSEKAAES